MKGQTVGTQVDGLLWPDSATMAVLYSLSRPHNDLLTNDTDSLGLLWPAELINEQAHSKRKCSFATPLALLAFVVTAILGIIIGPMQLILLALGNADYTWVASVYYPKALQCSMLVAAIISVGIFVALARTWRDHPSRAWTTLATSICSLITILIYWFIAQYTELPSHQLTLIFLALLVISIIAIVLTYKYSAKVTKFTLPLKLMLSIFSILAIVDFACSAVYFCQASSQTDPSELNRLRLEQENAQVEGVSVVLSNSLFTLCNGKYQIVYQGAQQDNGIFECVASGDVYSAKEIPQSTSSAIYSAATYLGTTKDTAVTLAFPQAHYLYRSIPQALSEDELAIMWPATSERELLDNITQPLLDYWSQHSDHNLYLNVFYTRDINSIQSTRDFVLMAALDTMVKSESLPRGNTLLGYADGKMENYIYSPDFSLSALNELAEDHDAYPTSTLDSLALFRHISIHLEANEELTYDTLYQKLQESFIGGA